MRPCSSGLSPRRTEIGDVNRARSAGEPDDLLLAPARRGEGRNQRPVARKQIEEFPRGRFDDAMRDHLVEALAGLVKIEPVGPQISTLDTP